MGGGSSKFDELFSLLPASPTTHIIIIGLHNAGKSTIMHSMGLKSRIQNIPTVGMPILTVKSGRKLRITSWDIGGPGKIRSMWEHFFSVAKGIVFVVDSSDKEAFVEAKMELHAILCNKKLNRVPLMVMANKQDITDSMLIPDISTGLQLCEQDRMWDILATSGLSGDGVYEAMKGLVDMINIFLRHPGKP